MPSIINALSSPRNIIRTAVGVAAGAVITETMSALVGPFSWPSWAFVTAGSQLMGYRLSHFVENCIESVRNQNPLPEVEEEVDLGLRIVIDPNNPPLVFGADIDLPPAIEQLDEDQPQWYVPESPEEAFQLVRNELIEGQKRLTQGQAGQTEENELYVDGDDGVQVVDEEERQIQAAIQSSIEESNVQPEAYFVEDGREPERIPSRYGIDEAGERVNAYKLVWHCLSRPFPENPVTMVDLSPESMQKIQQLTGIHREVFDALWFFAGHPTLGPSNDDSDVQNQLRTDFRRQLFIALLQETPQGKQFHAEMRNHVPGLN